MESSSEKLTALMTLLGINLLFLLPLVALLGIVYVWKRPAFAVLKRNFVAYFTNPTGYAFLCLFVALTSYAAFWPEEFFNSNLANLDQLNSYLPLIMLIFIPAITMSIWAEERRQGTDELLLTMPADDFDIVLGKYLAAAAIFTVSLMFSQIANYLVLINLGNPDMGLFLGNYFGYWMVGLAMLAIGMVASFLTSNLTVGFILGVVFAAPLVVASLARVLLPEPLGSAIGEFSIAEKFQDFEAGVISLSSIAFFVMIIVTMLYLCMVLIGRRHWSGGKDGKPMGGHYAIRTIALIVIAGGISVFAAHRLLVRADVTSEKLSSLSDSSVDLIKSVTDASDQYLIKIEAFISEDLPEEFVQKRFDLLTALREIKAAGGDKISLKIHDQIDLFGEEANRAETLYGIKQETVETRVRGATTSEDVIFGVAFQSGLERSVVPFMGISLPIEYELMRSLATVTQQDRKTIGVLQTDADLMGASSFSRPGSGERPLIEELRKQYNVVSLDPNSPITDEFDVLLAVQPSSLTQPQMDSFMDVVRSGKPTAIFEDPFPLLLPAPGTSQPKRPPGGMMGMRQQPQPKGDIGQLWDLLDVELLSGEGGGGGGFPNFSMGGEQALVIWQDYNPHPEDAEAQNEFVWITTNCGAAMPFNDEESITSGLQKMLLLYPGGIVDVGNDIGREFVPLLTTGGRNSGTITYDQCVARNPIGQLYLRSRDEVEADEKPTSSEYVLAAHIRVKGEQDESKDADSDAEDGADTAATNDVNVVLVTDIDVVSGFFFELRARSEIFGERFSRWEVDNVPLVLNILDQLADDSRFIDIRKRRGVHRELASIQRLTEEAKTARSDARKKSSKKFKKILDDEQKKFDDIYESLEARDDISKQQEREELAIARDNGRESIEAKKAQLDRKRDQEYRDIEKTMAAEVRDVQNNYKLLAVLIPPIPPLIIAICVFFVRRSRERESVSASRLV